MENDFIKTDRPALRRSTNHRHRSTHYKAYLQCTALSIARCHPNKAVRKYTASGGTSFRRFQTDIPDCCNPCSPVLMPAHAWRALMPPPDCPAVHGLLHCNSTIWHFCHSPTYYQARFWLPCSSRYGYNFLLPVNDYPLHNR